MSLLLTPRYSSATTDTAGDVDSHGGALRRKIESKRYARVKVLKRRLKELKGELPERVEIEDSPAITKELERYEPETRAQLQEMLAQALLQELYQLLSVLETAQIEEVRVLELLKKLEEEELALFMVMMS